MTTGENGNHVCADLVYDVTVGCDPVRAYNHGIDLSSGHHVACHAVRDKGDGNVLLHQLPDGQPCSLQEWARFAGNDGNLFSARNGGANDAECGPVSRCGKRACIAVSQYARSIRKKGRAVLAKRGVAVNACT